MFIAPGFSRIRSNRFSSIVSRLVNACDTAVAGVREEAKAPADRIILSDTQARAVDLFIDWYGALAKGDASRRPFFYIAGYAGTGKSTLAKVALARLRDACVKEINGMAFTAKAALVLRNKGGIKDSDTIHSSIYRWNGSGFEVSADLTEGAQLLVVDECYMVNTATFNDILSLGIPVLALGDPGQLGPVVGESYFADVTSDVILTEPRRSDAESGIIQLATMVRNGKMPAIGEYGSDAIVLPLNKETQHLLYRPDTQPICGINRVRWTYSQRIRRLRGFGGPLPMAGETILWRRNMRDVGLINGMVGVTTAEAADVGEGLVTLTARFDDDAQHTAVASPYLFSQHFAGDSVAPSLGRGVGAADWGYVLTCHATQGSEYDNVTVVDDTHAFRDSWQRWMYTALTRASRRVTLLVRER